mgnify:CR=1 FL=1
MNLVEPTFFPKMSVLKDQRYTNAGLFYMGKKVYHSAGQGQLRLCLRRNGLIELSFL